MPDNVNLVVYGGYEDVYYRFDNINDDDEDDGIPCLRFWTVTGTLWGFVNNRNGQRVVCDRFTTQLVDPMSWCIDQQLHMDIAVRTNKRMRDAADIISIFE